MHQDNGARVNEFQHTLRHCLRCRSIFVVGADRPEDNGVAFQLRECKHPVVQEPSWRPEKLRANSCDTLYGGGAFFNLRPDLIPVFFRQVIGVRVGVVANFVPLRNNLPGNFWELFHLLANQKESRFDIIPLQDVQNFWRVNGVRSVVKSQRNDLRKRFVGKNFIHDCAGEHQSNHQTYDYQHAQASSPPF